MEHESILKVKKKNTRCGQKMAGRYNILYGMHILWGNNRDIRK